ncbi:MAG TPA: hypothetical protein VJV23_12755, partial [Candidatus Polarisedimenticolia bacterium]|nr:hypothetical protein [Candidatus Polarisedimenticolia bacterium]
LAAGLAPAIALAAAPWLILDVAHNHAAVNAAIAFHLGNRPGADGHQSVFPGASEAPTVDPDARRHHMTGLDLTGVRLAAARAGVPLDGVAVYWVGQTLDSILDQPLSWLGLLARKTLLFVNGFHLTTQKDLYVAGDFSPMLALGTSAGPICYPLGVILPLSAAGFLANRLSRAGSLLLAAPAGALAAALLFTHDARFQYPASLILMVPASRGLFALAEAVARRRPLVPAAFALGLLVCNADLLGTHRIPVASEYFRAGTMHLDQGRPREAAHAYLRSIQADPAYVPSLDNLAAACRLLEQCDRELDTLERLHGEGHASFDLLYTLADLRLLAGRPAAAAAMARRTAELHPGRPEAYRLMAAAHGAAGDGLAAASALRQGMEAVPGDRDLILALGAELARQGRLLEAEEVLVPARRGHPDDIALLGLLGQVYGMLDRREDEQECYRAVLDRQPGHPEALFGMAASAAAQGRLADALDWAARARQAGHAGAGELIRDLTAPGTRGPAATAVP